MQRLYSLTFTGAAVVVLAEAGPSPDAWLMRPAPRSMSLSSLEYLLMSADGSDIMRLVYTKEASWQDGPACCAMASCQRLHEPFSWHKPICKDAEVRGKYICMPPGA